MLQNISFPWRIYFFILKSAGHADCVSVFLLFWTKSRGTLEKSWLNKFKSVGTLHPPHSSHILIGFAQHYCLAFLQFSLIQNIFTTQTEKIWLNKYTIAFKADLFQKLKDTGLCVRANIFFILCLQSTAHRGKCERICCFDERWIAPAMTVIFFIRDI